MENTRLTLDDVIQMTLDVGEDWAVSHAERLLVLIDQISPDISYDFQIMEFAAYLHDWGAYPRYEQKGVEHSLRSRQVIEEEVLSQLDLTSHQKDTLLETIELHDYRDTRRTKSNEALLLREADMLEFIGIVGMAREFARGPKDLEACYRRILARRDHIQGRFILPSAQQIAKVRFERLEQCLVWLEEESFGTL